MGQQGGPDGLCLQHLKVLNSTSAEREGRKLLQAVKWWINIVLEGIETSFNRSAQKEHQASLQKVPCFARI